MKRLLRFGILTISDRSASGEREDLSGPALMEVVVGKGWDVIKKAIIPDDRNDIKNILIEWVERGDIEIILTTGGTGFALRDITPEATREIIERPAPGLTEAMRSASLAVTQHAMLSRAEAGIRGNTLIVNLPGSPKGAVENLRTILGTLPHAVGLLNNDGEAESKH